MKVLLDECLPLDFRHHLPAHEIHTGVGWIEGFEERTTTPRCRERRVRGVSHDRPRYPASAEPRRAQDLRPCCPLTNQPDRRLATSGWRDSPRIAADSTRADFIRRLTSVIAVSLHAVRFAGRINPFVFGEHTPQHMRGAEFMPLSSGRHLPLGHQTEVRTGELVRATVDEASVIP